MQFRLLPLPNLAQTEWYLCFMYVLH
jgi:hypothetical protein